MSELKGYSSATQFSETRRFVSGRPLDKYDARSVVVSAFLAESLNLRRFDTVWLATPDGFQDYVVTGIIQESGPSIIMPLFEAQKAFTSGLPLLSWYDLHVKRSARVSSLAAEVQAILPETMTLQMPRDNAFAGLLRFRLLLVAVAVLGTLAGIYLLLSNLSLVKLEREKEFRTLHAMGLSKVKLSRYLFGELALILAIPMLVAGLLSAYGFKMLERLMQEHVFTFLPFDVGNYYASILVSTSLLLTLTVLLVIFFSVRNLFLQTSNEAVLNAFQDTKTKRTEISRTIFSRLNVQLPAKLWLGQKVLQNFRKRDAYAVAFLVISISLTFAFAGLANSYQSSLKTWMNGFADWDLVVMQKDQVSGVSIPLAESLKEKIEALPGVSAVASDYKTTIHQGNLKANLFISDSYQRPLKSIQGIATDALPTALSNGRRIAIAESLATLYDLDVESTLTITTPTGEKVYDIVAIVDDRGAEPRGIFIDRRQYGMDWQLPTADQFTVSLADKSQVAEVATLIEKELSSSYLVNVLTTHELEEASLSSLSESFGFVRMFIGALLLIAVMHLFTTNAERLPQLAKDLRLLRTLGAANQTIRQMLFGNFTVMFGMVAFCGMALGTLLSVCGIELLKYSGSFTLAWSWPSHIYLTFALFMAFSFMISWRLLENILKRQMSQS